MFAFNYFYEISEELQKLILRLRAEAELDDAIQFSNIPVLRSFITSGTEHQKGVALQALATYTEEGGEGNDTIIREAGLIEVLVAPLLSGTDWQKYVSADILWGLAGSRANRVVIADAGGIPLLIALTQTGNEQQKEVAGGALFNVLRDVEKNHTEFRDAQGVEAMSALLSSGTYEPSCSASNVIWELASDVRNHYAIEASGCIKKLVVIALTWDGRAQAGAEGALEELASKSLYMKGRIEATGYEF